MTTNTVSAPTTAAGTGTLAALRGTLRTRRDQLAERRAVARELGAYPATRSAAIVVLPTVGRRAA